MVWVAGHFGEWVQGIAGPSREVALITLACPVRGVGVTWEDAQELSVEDATGLLDPPRAAALLQSLGRAPRGRIVVHPDLPAGGGAGMSTATLVALARAVGASGASIAPACLAVEGAVDPLMLEAPDAVLWAPRRAQVLAALPAPPEAAIIGGFLGAPEWTDAADTCFPVVDDLCVAWAKGPDLALAARLASASAERTTALRGPANDRTAALAEQLGAVGWARAHTGSARALIFSPGGVPARAETALAAAGFTDILRFATGGRA